MRIQKGIASASLLAGEQSLFRIHSAKARHEQDTKCLRMASRNMDICPGVFFVIAKSVEFYNFVDCENDGSNLKKPINMLLYQ